MRIILYTIQGFHSGSKNSWLKDFFVLQILRPPKLYTQEDGRVFLHPKSVNAEVTVFEDNWMIYHEKMKSSSVGQQR